MALPLPEGSKIQITHRNMPGDYSMPALEVAEDHYTLLYLIHGDRTIITPTVTYTSHSGYVHLIAPYVYHQTVPASEQYYESILIKFSPDYLDFYKEQLGTNFFEQLFESPYCHFNEDIKEIINELFFEILKVYQQDSAYKEVLLQSMLVRLLIIIYENAILDEESTFHTTALTKPILEAIFFMEKNYTKQIKIKDVAEISGYAVAYFSRLFQKQLGKSFSEYLCNIRLRHVESLLLSTSKSITEISFETGFQYPGNMSSLFQKKVGLTPKEYRKQKRIL